MDDLESLEAIGGLPGHLDVIDMRQGGRFAVQCLRKSFQRCAWAIHFDVHPRGGIAHPARQLQPARQAVDERAETDPLDDAADVDP